MDQYQTTEELTNTLNNSVQSGISGYWIIGILVASLLIAILFGFATASIANYNERRRLNAFFAGFFLGPLGVVAYMIMGESIELRVHLEQKALKDLNKKSTS
jgi:hypothetical protein